VQQRARKRGVPHFDQIRIAAPAFNRHRGRHPGGLTIERSTQMATENTAKRPTHYIYAVTKRGDDDKGFWTRIGATFEHGDSKGFSVVLDLVPINGADIVMREPKEEEQPK
jgi:hypothetical protein